MHRPVSAPGNTSADWKIHLGFDLGSLTISQVKLTDFRGGESLKRFKFSPGDVVVADRGYSRRGELATVIRQGGDFIIRLNWANVPMMDEKRKTIRFARRSSSVFQKLLSLISI